MRLEAIQDQTAFLLKHAEVFNEQTFDDLIYSLNCPELSVLDETIKTLKNNIFCDSELQGYSAFHRTGQLIIGSSLLSAAALGFFTVGIGAKKLRARVSQQIAITGSVTALGAFCAAKILRGRCRSSQMTAKAKIADVAMRMQMIVLKRKWNLQSQVLDTHTNIISGLLAAVADLRIGNEQNLALNRQNIMHLAQLFAQCAQLDHILSFMSPYSALMQLDNR